MSLSHQPSDRNSGPLQPQREPTLEFKDLHTLNSILLPGTSSSAPEEERFLNRWMRGLHPDGLVPSTREILVRNVFRAASHYPGPLSSIYDLTFSTAYSTAVSQFRRMPGISYEFSSLFLDGEKRNLYREASKELPYRPLNSPEAYKNRFNATIVTGDACPLCPHLAQGFDLELSHGPGSGTLLAYGKEYALIPNRFPPSPGPFDLLLLPLNHSSPPRGNHGYVVTPRDLEVVRECCAALGMVAHHNHVRDGMTVPQHDHWKLTPLEVPAGRWLELSSYAAAAASTKDLWVGPLPGTPFDTLAITGSNLTRVNETVAHILGELEKAGEVATLWYSLGVFAILPRWKSTYASKPSLPTIATNLGSHLLVANEPISAREIEQKVPFKGEFPWEHYCPHPIPSIAHELSNTPLRGRPSAEVLWQNEIPASLSGKTAVVIDVLAATTNIADMLASGAELYLTSSVRVLHDLEALRAQGKQPLIIGETLDPVVRSQLSFYCSNDPRAIRNTGILQNGAGKTILFLSNNGTRVVVDALTRGADRIIAGSFVNISAVAHALRSDTRESLLLPAGEIQFKDEYREGEDFEYALLLSRQVRGQTPDPTRYCEAARSYVLGMYHTVHPAERQATFYSEFSEILDLVIALDRNPVVPLCSIEPVTGCIKVTHL